jgi:glycosyltransferase involved in cell wall biosynthesis
MSGPVLFVTGHAPFDRVGAFARLHEREDVEFVLFGGRSRHGGIAAGEERWDSDEPRGPDGPSVRTGPSRLGEASLPREPPLPDGLPFPHRHVHQREVAALAASGRYRAVVCSTGGRVALPGAWAGARRSRAPLILWTSLWAHPRSVAHAFSYAALRRLYRSADAVVTYGPHVSAYARARGARNVYVAAQSVDNDFWGAPDVSPPQWTPDGAGRPDGSPDAAPPGAAAWPGVAAVKFLFAGRPAREKGVRVLIEAWSTWGLGAPTAALVLVGVGSCPPWVPAGGAVRGDAGGRPHGATALHRGGVARRNAGGTTPGVVCLDPVAPARLRDLYAAADALVVPSIATRTFREPWGLVVNEAMNRQLPVIASDAVGAVAGGLVRDGHNGLVVPAGNPAALAHALRRLAADPALRARLGAAGARDVAAFGHDAWAEGFSRALASLGLSRTLAGPGSSRTPAAPGSSVAPAGPGPSRAPSSLDVSRGRW